MIKSVSRYFPADFSEIIAKIEVNACEIRMRISKPLSVIKKDKIYFVDKNGAIISKNSSGIIIERQVLDEVFEKIFRYSLHSFEREIAQGFITLDGGHRASFCGTAVYKNGEISGVKDISSINIRIAREVLDCSDEIFNAVFSSGLKNTLIVGAPMSGKTTILRDLCRKLGNYYKTAIIDERSEIAAVYKGSPQNDVGVNSDIFNGYDKYFGVLTAVRVMSPQVICIDEAGSENDIKAFQFAANSGVKIVATIHGEKLSDVKNKLDLNLFEYIIFLENKGGNSKIKTIEKVKDYD